MAERNDISSLLAFISRNGDWCDRLESVVDKHLRPALEIFEIDQDPQANPLCEHWSGVRWLRGFEGCLCE